MTDVDLHMHSNYSDDGEYTVAALFAMAAEKGLKMIAITDHDTADANAEAVKIAKEYGIDYLPGIEVSCQYQGIDLHVLGYNIDYRDPQWQIRYHKLVTDYNQLFYKITDLLEAFLQVQIDTDRLISEADGKMVNGEDVCAYLLKDERNRNNPLLRPYFPGGQRSDMPLVNFYWDYMAQGKVAYVPLEGSTSVKEAVELIKRGGGFAVLAHPGQNLKGHEDLLPGIMGNGISGLEVYTTYHDQQQIAYYRQKALEYDCLITCGSDFHGAIKPVIAMGEHHGDIRYAELKQDMIRRGLL